MGKSPFLSLVLYHYNHPNHPISYLLGYKNGPTSPIPIRSRCSPAARCHGSGPRLPPALRRTADRHPWAPHAFGWGGPGGPWTPWGYGLGNLRKHETLGFTMTIRWLENSIRSSNWLPMKNREYMGIWIPLAPWLPPNHWIDETWMIYWDLLRYFGFNGLFFFGEHLLV